jgi:hypothetical protein
MLDSHSLQGLLVTGVQKPVASFIAATPGLPTQYNEHNQ